MNVHSNKLSVVVRTLDTSLTKVIEKKPFV